MLRPVALATLLLVLSLAGCATSSALKSGSAKAVTATQSLPPPDTTAASGAYVGVSDYRVGPLDLLEVSVFQVPDLNRTVRINTSGQISLPLIGAIRAGGKTVTELEAEIAANLDLPASAEHDRPARHRSLRALLAKIEDAPTDLVRRDPAFGRLGLTDADVATADQVVEVLAAHPEVMQRPVLVRGDRAIIGRPKGRVPAFLAGV